MSRKLTSLLVGVFASLAFTAGVMQGCGGGGGSGDNVSLCQQACDKALACVPDAGPEAQQVAVQCKQTCATQVPMSHCSNEAAIASAIRSCLMLACDAYQNCNVPDCVSTTGTGGAGGGGGTMGGGGTGGSGGWTCLESADGCACAPGTAGSQTGCTGTYNCCFTFTSGAAQACTCSNATTASDCTTAVSALNGTKVGSCPP